ncbi:MAG: PD-(D/E)XK nuclease family protein [Nitrospiraceae bacterium]
MATTTRKLSPSDFSFLWEECKRCFYLKTVKGFYRPRPIMPKIFTVIDAEMKKWFTGRRTESFAPGLQAGSVQFGEKWVESRPGAIPGSSSTYVIRGKFDTVVKFDDQSYGVIDFKTSETRPDHVRLYGRQLHAYARALEDPAEGNFALKPISRLGLLVFRPSAFSNDTSGTALLAGDLRWIEVPRDDAGFATFMSEVGSVLDLPAPPEPAASCEWCKYRRESLQNQL